MAKIQHVDLLYPSYSDIVNEIDNEFPQLYYYVCLNGSQVLIDRIRGVYRVFVSGWHPPHRLYAYSDYDVACPIARKHLVYETKQYRSALRVFYELSDYLFDYSKKASGLFELDL